MYLISHFQVVHLYWKCFGFKILAFCCDMPARSFIKCCKGHTSYYACERCSVKGETVKKNKVKSRTSHKQGK